RTGRGLLLGGPRTTAVAPVAAAAPAARPTAARLAQVLQLLRVEPGAGALRARQHPLGALGDPEVRVEVGGGGVRLLRVAETEVQRLRSEEHTSELQSRENLVCRLLLEKKNTSQ